jgi:ferredoxin-NADP reductase
VPRYIRLQPIPGTPARTAGAAPIVCTVAARAQITDDIVSLHLAIPPERAVEFDAGAHIDVHTPSGAIRQYSLVNAPGERREFIIGVKKEPQSRGGSRSIHDMLQIGERVSVSEPRNNFALSDTHGALLIAGGIGITPIVAMAQALAAQARPFALHYFARSTAHVAFRERLDALTGVRLQLGLDAHLTRSAVGHIVAGLPADSDLYVCGPRPLIDCVRVWAKDLGIDPRRVHAELFAHDVDTSDDKAFRVRLHSSGAELEVPAGVSLAAALNARGYTIDTSCEQGVCGTCRIGVLDGLPEHRDVYLSEADKATGHCMMPCVSRSRSALLVLDL